MKKTKKNEIRKAADAPTADNGALKVEWLSSPLDITISRNGSKLPKRKFQVRGIARDDYLEREANLDRGAISRLLAVITKLVRHGYEARLDEKLRFVHMYDPKDGLYLSPQLLKPYRDEVLKDVKFRLNFDGREIDDINEVRKPADDDGGDSEEVTPDTTIVCPKCHLRIRVGRKTGGD